MNLEVLIDLVIMHWGVRPPYTQVESSSLHLLGILIYLLKFDKLSSKTQTIEGLTNPKF